MKTYRAKVYKSSNDTFPEIFENVASVEMREGHLFIYAPYDKNEEVKIRLLAVFVPGNWIAIFVDESLKGD